jgi:hypothetical protein
MWDELGPRLIGALAQAARERLGEAHPFVAACVAADVRDMRARLDELPAADADALLADAHRRLREDPAAWLAHWRPARPN